MPWLSTEDLDGVINVKDELVFAVRDDERFHGLIIIGENYCSFVANSVESLAVLEPIMLRVITECSID